MRSDLAARHHSTSCVVPFFASSSTRTAQPSPPVAGTCMHALAAAAPLPRRRRGSCAAAVPFPRRHHRAACPSSCCLPTDKGAIGLCASGLQKGRETARQRQLQKHTTEMTAARESARARNGRRHSARVLTSQCCVHLRKVSSQVEPACPQNAADSCCLAAEAERRNTACGRLTGDKRMAKEDGAARLTGCTNCGVHPARRSRFPRRCQIGGQCRWLQAVYHSSRPKHELISRVQFQTR